MNFWNGNKPFLISAASLLLVLVFAATGWMQVARADLQVGNQQSDDSGTTPENPTLANDIFVPLLFSDHPWESPFGVESNLPLLDSNTLLPRASDLQLGWARMGYQVSWRKLQPNPGDIPKWELLATFEDELRGLKATGIRPVVVIKDTPYWALDPVKARDANGNLTSCGAIAADYFDEFAIFVSKVVTRYNTAEFNVLDWELGNEPDVDPTAVPQDYAFGCWGDKDDPYYGGKHYGRMLMAVAPEIRKTDSRARIWIGGLLLNSPNSAASSSMSALMFEDIETFRNTPYVATETNAGLPELFLKGILEAGAAPHFDVVPYHWYATYWDFLSTGTRYDWDLYPQNQWYSWGGGTVGKARFLRQTMAAYGVDKPVVLNETGFGCKEDPQYIYCDAPDNLFFASQATHLIRYFIRGLSENVSGFVWYTLNGPGWRNVGLLDGSGPPLPRNSYIAYQQLSDILQYARYRYPVSYDPDIEAYAFRSGPQHVHVLWAKEDQTVEFYVPKDKFIRAERWDGSIIYDQTTLPPQIGSDYRLEVDFSPIYLVRYP
jgi:hypothetical protein